MTIEEAIEILESLSTSRHTGETKGAADAERLGIEALKGIQRYRQNFNEAYIERLPGETEK